MRKHLKGLKNAEYILKIIISNHGGFHSVVFEMNVFIKGNKQTFPMFKPLYNFGQIRGEAVLVCLC